MSKAYIQISRALKGLFSFRRIKASKILSTIHMKKRLKNSAFPHIKSVDNIQHFPRFKASKNVKLQYGFKAENLFSHSKKCRKTDITSTVKCVEKKKLKICKCSFQTLRQASKIYFLTNKTVEKTIVFPSKSSVFFSNECLNIGQNYKWLKTQFFTPLQY